MTIFNATILRLIKPLVPGLLVILPLLLSGQSDSTVGDNIDTLREIELSEVFIADDRVLFFQEERSLQTFDEDDLERYSHYDISELLSTLSIANVRYGGLGGNANISIRGTAPDHTVVLWNGFNINSSTLGEMDLSLIPTEAADQAAIVYNGASALLGSGAFGGAVLLNNKPNWNSKFGLSYRLKAGSFNYHGHHLKITTGNTKVQYVLKGFYQKALNEFEYKDRYKVNEPVVRQSHNALDYYGVIQNLFIRTAKSHHLEFGAWTQWKHKEIPPKMGQYKTSNQLQDDKNYRFYGQWRKLFKKGWVQFKSAFMHDYLHFTDKANATDTFFLVNSELTTKRILNQAKYRHTFNKYVKGEVGAEFNVLLADVKTYGGKVKENLGAVYIDIQPSFKSFSSHISLRQEIDKTTDYLRPLLFFGLRQSLLNKRLLLLFSYADKYRKPDFNERYWQPGGNPQLKHETGWGIDGGFKLMLLKRTKQHEVSISANYYRTIITNGIVWQPGNQPFWSPQNVNKIKTQGLESELTYQLSLKNDLKTLFAFRYHFNRTIDFEEKTLLAYKPNHIAKTNITIDQEHVMTGINCGYVSRQFTDDSENKIFELPGYPLLDIHIFGKYTYKTLDLLIGLEIKNLTNTAYEVQRTIAQPGRAYYFNLSISFNKPLIKKQKS